MRAFAASDPPRAGEGDQPKVGGGGSTSLRKPVVYTARRLRREMTLPEVLLWQELRNKPAGLKFRRQHPVEPYVVDFFCPDAALVVEIDGASHDASERKAHDQLRDEQLNAKGLTIVRTAAVDVLRNPALVAQAIIERAGHPLHRHSPVPLPAGGEEP